MVSISNGWVHKYTQYRFEKYVEGNAGFSNLPQKKKDDLIDAVSKKASVFLIIAAFPYCCFLIFLCSFLSTEGNAFVMWLYQIADGAYQVILNNEWGVATPKKRAMLFLFIIKLLPLIMVVIIALIPLFCLDIFIINKLLQVEIKNICK